MTEIPEPRAFIEQNLRLQPAPSVPEITLYAAHPGSGLWRLLGRDNKSPPYWAYNWAGGAVLARHLLDTAGMVAGRRIIDLGTGSGIVAIAAAKCGAAHVTAIDIDPIAVIAAGLNAEANGVAIETLCGNILDASPPAADLVLAGDLFYAPALARKVLPFLRRCRDAGIHVLIGDPGRKPLPQSKLRRVAEYPVMDFGDVNGDAQWIGSVYTL